MSHFVVAVFHRPDQDFEDLLAPYNEQDEMYMDFEPCGETPEELRAKYEEEKDNYESFEEFMEGYYGYGQDENGVWGYLTNNNARWDWYQVGGRWSGYLKLRDGTRADEAAVSDVDFSLDTGAYRKAIRWWEVCVDEEPLAADEKEDDFFSFFKPEYYREQFGTKEKYAEERASVIPWACVTADGEWLEKGTMGWFAMNDATSETRKEFNAGFMDYVKDHPDYVITMVDCHI